MKEKKLAKQYENLPYSFWKEYLERGIVGRLKLINSLPIMRKIRCAFDEEESEATAYLLLSYFDDLIMTLGKK